MKSVLQTSKTVSTVTKSKKTVKDREKRKSQAGNSDSNNYSSPEKDSPLKETNNTRLYAGIDSESLIIYGQQVGIEHLNEEILNTLSEDINYKLRYIINDSLVRARLSGRNAINSNDISQTFENLNIDRVYGASTQPNWTPFGYQNLHYLEEKTENLVEIADTETIGIQYSETILFRKWLPEFKELGKPLKTYFTSMCQSVVHNDEEIRRVALNSISTNPRIGSIVEWFYNFGYILLAKDLTYDCLTIRALDLIEVLELSPSCRLNVSEKLLKLLVRLILQRLLKPSVAIGTFKRISTVLEILCRRGALKDFVLLKIEQKFQETFENSSLAIVTIVIRFGDDAINSILLPNLDLFLEKVNSDPEYTSSTLELYNVLWKEGFMNNNIYNKFHDIFGDALTIFHQTIFPEEHPQIKEIKEINLSRTKCIQTRRKITSNTILSTKSILPLESVFVMPPKDSVLYQKLIDHKLEMNNQMRNINNNNVIIGKTTLLLPVFTKKNCKIYSNTCDTSLMYNF